MVRSLLVVPTSSASIGTGLAHRVRQWQHALAGIGDLDTVVVPIAGSAQPGDDVVTPGPDTDPELPRLARGLTIDWGRHQRRVAENADVVVAVRSYLGLFALGIANASNAPVIVDLDDDDADYFRQIGDDEEAGRYDTLIHRLRAGGAVLTSAGGLSDTTTVPNALPEPLTNRTLPIDSRRIVMVGNFRYGPNIEGARWFLDSVLPQILVTEPGLELRLIGPGSEQFTPFGVGLVDDLSTEYIQARTAVCPILTGSGTRTKIIEAWMHGVPVVATSLGANGLDARPGTNILIADTPNDFADSVLRTLSDDDLAARLAESGLATSKSYGYDVTDRIVADLIVPMTTGRRRLFAMAPSLHLTDGEDGLVVIDQVSNSVHDLNSTAAMVLLLADGTLDIPEIAAGLQEALGLDERPDQIVLETIEGLHTAGLLVHRLV